MTPAKVLALSNVIYVACAQASRPISMTAQSTLVPLAMIIGHCTRQSNAEVMSLQLMPPLVLTRAPASETLVD